MSGVFGWIDFTRDLVLDRPVVTMLTATLAQRGPDGEAVWVSPRAALGYRTLDVDGNVGRQPFVTEVDGSPVVVAVTGAPLGVPCGVGVITPGAASAVCPPSAPGPGGASKSLK